MWLCYIDESGNTGRRLDDPDQPIHWMAAVLVPETKVLELTNALDRIIGDALPGNPSAELHAVQLHSGDGPWESAQRIASWSCDARSIY